MQDERKIKQEQQEEDVVLDLRGMLEDYISCLGRYWTYFLFLTLIIAILVFLLLHYSYTPLYSASVTYSVNKTNVTSTDALISVRLSDAISTLTAEKEFREDLVNESEEEVVATAYSFSSSYTASTNLFSVTVTSDDYESTNLLLNLFMEVYPEWASRSVGTVELQVVDWSYTSSTPTNPYSRVTSALTGILVGLAVSFVIATIYVLTISTVRKESDMQKVTTKDCISVIPNIKEKKRSEKDKISLLINSKHINWGLRQSILSAHSRIEKMMESEEQKVLLITSTLPHEGKSMISVNLALAFAEQGKKVALIDGDLRNPSVLKAFGIEERPGLSEYLNGAKELRMVRAGNIYIVAGGMEKGTASTMADDSKMTSLMKSLRDRFDYIIIDTPPSYGFTDAEILSKYADAVVYVVSYDAPTIREVKEGIFPYIAGKKLIGYLMNRNPGGYSTYGKYGKYGRYGYGYGYYGRYGRYGSYGYGYHEKRDRKTGSKEAAMDTESTL